VTHEDAVAVSGDTMRAVVATPDGPGWTERREVPVPEPSPGEALIAVRAFSVNRGELRLLRSRGEGWRPGQDVAGEIMRPAADGAGPAGGTQPGPEAGARVAGLADWHGWAQYAAVPAHRVATLPDEVDWVRAAALPMAGTTALNLVRGCGALLGRRMLVAGASGGVGHLAVQLAAAAGAEVTAVAAERHRDELSARGAAEVVPEVARAPDLYDFILESAGGASLAAAVEHIAPGGTIVCFGNSSRERTPISFSDFFDHAEARIQTYFSARHEAEAGAGLEVLLELLSEGRLHVEVGFEAGWDRLEDALDGLEARRFPGKAVLLVD
jgi:NADPH:quinone reductase